MSVWTYSRIYMADIVAEVSHVFRIPEAGLRGRSRIRKIVRPRFACAYLGQRLTYSSYPMMGKALGGRDHSTIIHAVDQAKLHMERDPEFRAYVDAVRIRLLSSRARAEQRRREAIAVDRERLRREREHAESAAAAEAAAEIIPNDMDDLSNAVAAYVANGGSFIEVYA